MRHRTLGSLVAVLTLAVVMALPPNVGAPSTASGPDRSTPLLAGASAVLHGVPSPVSVSPWHNTTWAPSAMSPFAAAPTISAVQVTPVPRPPPTTPTVMTFLTGSQTCCVQANFSAPSGGPWAMVVLNYTGQAVGGVYDSSFRAYIDQVQVLFGTTPEYGIWYVSRDVTPYESLLNGTFNFTFLLSAATVGGYFLSSVSLAFYPPVTGTPLPEVPSQIIPLFHRVFISTGTPTVTASATVPSNVVNATLELWTYGFGPDEFWYATQSPYRALGVQVDGQPIVAQLPFPYINTGGSDLFAWRPITAAFTLEDRPYDIDVTAALGLLEGAHNFTANLTGVTATSNWLIGGALLLYTSPSAGAAALSSYRFSDPPARLVTDHASYFDQFNNISFAYASDIPGTNGTAHASVATNESFASWLKVDATGAWNNLTASETFDSAGVLSGPSGTTWTNRTILYPLAMDLGQTFVVTSTTGGSYPIFGNFTSYFLNAVQEWSERTEATSVGPTGVSSDSLAIVDNRVTGGVNVFAGTEELTGPNAALLLSITFVESSTTDVFSETIAGGPRYFAFQHVLVGTSYQPPAPNNVETVVTDTIDSPLSAELAASSPLLEQGQPLTLVATVRGGEGALSYAFSGLPPGCVTVDSPLLACTPTSPGSYVVQVVGEDGVGARSVPASVAVTILGPPTVQVSTNSSIVDVGGNAYAAAAVSGGVPPYTCTWSVDGTPQSRQPCDQGFVASPSALGTTNVSVTASDAAGGFSAPGWFLFESVPHATAVFSSSAGTTLSQGGSTVVSVVISGGVAPFTFAWFLNGTAVPNITGASFWMSDLAPGDYQVSLQLTDSANITAFQQGPTISVIASTTPCDCPAAAPPVTLFFAGGLAIGVAAGAIVGVLVARAMLRPKLRPLQLPRVPPPSGTR